MTNAIQIILENNQDDPYFCEAVNKLVNEYSVTDYLGDDSGYNYEDETVLFTSTQFFAMKNKEGVIRLGEFNHGSSHNNYFSCK